MTAKEIIEGMAYTPWENKTGNIFGNGGFHVMGYFAKSPTDCANAHAITTTVNATYGKGFDPLQYPELIEAVERMLKLVATGAPLNVDSANYNTLNNILNTAKIK